MLGSVMDAEDMVQETFLRWQQTAETPIQSPKAYLTAIITRLCIDHLRSARVQRESYLGPWLPEPLLTDDTTGAAELAALSDSLSMAFLVLLEKLSPLERAVFLLREVFDYDYAEIAPIVGKTEANCRQLVRRARQRLSDGRPRFETSPAEQQTLTIQFAQACATGDLDGLLHILAEDITLWSDGGGKVSAARQPIFGSDRVSRFLLGLMKKAPPDLTTRFALVNGQPGFVNYIGGRPNNVLTLEIGNGRIQAIRVVVNPDKLKTIPPL
jgi:RNA polymerase sigma-70 factor (ECF subfamily)